MSDLPWAPRQPHITWSVLVATPTSGVTPLLAHHPERLLKSASIGKLFLLVAVAERLRREPQASEVLLSKPRERWAEASGLWRHMALERLPVEDLTVESNFDKGDNHG